MRLIVVCNEKSGSQAWPADAIEARLEAEGHEAVLVPADGEWRAALENPADAYVAAGGDGTVRELASALAGSARPLAIIPLGTANNLARAFGYTPGSDPFGRVGRWGETERALRVERACCDGIPHPFLEVIGVGPFARILRGASDERRRRPLAALMSARRRLLHGVLEGPVLEAEIVVDGRTAEGRFVMIACLRIPSFGPALWLAPDQHPESEELTVVAVRNDQRESFAWWLATGEGDVTAYRLSTGTEVTLTSDGPVHLDDRLLETPKHDLRAVSVGGAARTVRMFV